MVELPQLLLTTVHSTTFAVLHIYTGFGRWQDKRWSPQTNVSVILQKTKSRGRYHTLPSSVHMLILDSLITSLTWQNLVFCILSIENFILYNAHYNNVTVKTKMLFNLSIYVGTL